MRRFLDSSPSRHTWSVRSEYSVVPQSRRSPGAGRTRHKASDGWNRLRSVAGVTGENSPHHTNQPRKSKTDRVLVKYFFARACTCLKVAERAEEMIF